jgi:dolichyl-diphosphooligosaccharide--protein glycosyltransferase
MPWVFSGSVSVHRPAVYLICSLFWQVFVILHVVALAHYIRRNLTPKMYRMALAFVVTVGTASALVLVAVLIALVAASPTKGWSGRSLSLLDP